MIDLNKIRNPKTLDAIAHTLSEFIAYNKPQLLEVYEQELGFDDGDLDADLEAARDLLAKVQLRANSLNHWLASTGVVATGVKPTGIPQTPAVVSASVGNEAS